MALIVTCWSSAQIQQRAAAAVKDGVGDQLTTDDHPGLIEPVLIAENPATQHELHPVSSRLRRLNAEGMLRS